MRPRHRHGGRPLGLYAANQIRSETPFSFTAGIIVGAVFCFGGIVLSLGILAIRSKEASAFGTAGSHVSGFLLAALLFISGAFIAHVGVIYWARRLLARVRLLSRERN